jgi:CRISPR/Cas system CMR-associated protein Cmr1 (group 7 of RAMP superfamily)
VWSLGSIGFSFVKNEKIEKHKLSDNSLTNPQIPYNETYFLEDLINFMEGKIELYSNFWQYLEPGTNIYLWECLGANFINNEIVLKKFRYHFDLAKKGIEPRKRVLNLIKK